MEGSTLLQNSTLNPSETVSSFPPHRRRPLRSRTYRALIGILSHSHKKSPQAQIQEESGGDIQVENGFDSNQARSPTLDHANMVSDGIQEVAQKNSIGSVDFLLIENQTVDCAIQVDKVRDNANTVSDNQTVELGTLDDLVMDKDFSIADYSEVLDSCFHMDMITEPSKAVDDSKENDTVLEESILKGAEHELQLKEMELEKLINNDNADEEIEEGEISGGADVSFDELHQDTASQGERSREMMRDSDDYFNKEEFTCNDEDRGSRQHQMSDPSVFKKVNSDCNFMKVNTRTTDGEKQDYRSQTVFYDSHMETQRSDPITPFSGKQSLLGRNLHEHAAENQTSATVEEDGNAKSNQRRKRPLTAERKAKKKKKERIKRAENNRKLGVKRLKLQPVMKPKTVSYCRHYLNGRCHEGENCKFSHDIVPLTKSKPCGHFARNSCMKGDDCPYDHQLSKYPCKNYSENGFCGRGFDCLFSHKISALTPTASNPVSTSAQHSVPEKGGSSSKVRKPEVKFSSPINDLSSSKNSDKRGMFHDKKTELLGARAVPKGIRLLSDVGCKTILVPEASDKASSEKVAPRKPRGINFLSFA